jgi:Host cell surface-exposed lipoprotein
METMIEKPRSRRRWWLIALIVVGGIAIIANSGGNDTAETFQEISEGLDTGTADEAPAVTEPVLQYTRSEDNAIRSAESYIDTMAFSREGLIEQLEYEGFTTAEATLAVDTIVVDWNEQAYKSAESYLDTMPFSRTELVDQLVYEGFTASQAAYGVGQTGL